MLRIGGLWLWKKQVVDEYRRVKSAARGNRYCEWMTFEKLAGLEGEIIIKTRFRPGAEPIYTWRVRGDFLDRS